MIHLYIIMDGDSHLSRMRVATHLKRHSEHHLAVVLDTALHQGKDLAVALGYERHC
jgi:hypothetical protein